MSRRSIRRALLALRVEVGDALVMALPERHAHPHIVMGLCDCDCPRCTVDPTPPRVVEVCVCPKCDPARCRLHLAPAVPVRPIHPGAPF